MLPGSTELSDEGVKVLQKPQDSHVRAVPGKNPRYTKFRTVQNTISNRLVS